MLQGNKVKMLYRFNGRSCRPRNTENQGKPSIKNLNSHMLKGETRVRFRQTTKVRVDYYWYVP